jgi:hypothetical protein
MGIQNFPAALQPIIQQGFLEREFQEGLHARLGFRAIADKEPFAVAVGESVTKTRRGLKAPKTAFRDPTTNSGLDNGITASGWTVEQYVLAIGQVDDSIDLNTVTSRVGIASQFMQNAKVNGIQAATTLDILARNALFNAYQGGNTRVTTTLGAPAATIAVDDIRGFQTAVANGVQIAVSVGNTMAVIVGATSYTLTGVVADGANVSTAPNGISGTLTFSGNVTVVNGTIGIAVISAVAPLVIRPNAKTATSGLIVTDLLTMQMVLNGVAQLRSNNVPDHAGAYNCYLDDFMLLELFQDGDFKLLYRGAYGSTEYKNGQIFELLGARFIPVNTTYQQKLGAVPIRRALLCGQGALIEGEFEATGYTEVTPGDSLISVIDGIAMVTREPLDRLQQIIAQSWYYIGGFAVPTDITANANVIPTASNSYFKRAVLLETA